MPKWCNQTLIVSFAVAATLPAISAMAQSEPADSLNGRGDIEVIGQRLSEAELRKQANDFVRRAGIANKSDPVARWIDPVCPKVVGIRPEYARIVETKMRDIARISGIRTAGERCSANIVVSFTTDAAGVVQQIAQKSPSRLSELNPTERRQLLSSNAPVRWWYNAKTQNADGMQTVSSDALLAPAGPTDGTTFSSGIGAESAIGNGTQTVQAYRSSIISTLAVRALVKATVVVDVNLAEGHSLEAVAGYAAMVAFAETSPSSQPMVNSILGLFAPGHRHDSPTEWDIALLRTLYSMPHNRAGWKQRRMLVGAIVDASRPDEARQ